MTESARAIDLHFLSICNGVGTTKDNKAWRFDPSKGRWVPLQHEWKPEKIHTY